MIDRQRKREEQKKAKKLADASNPLNKSNKEEQKIAPPTQLMFSN